MRAAVLTHGTRVLQAIFDWVDIAGNKLATMSPIGTDLETVKQQIEELKVGVGLPVGKELPVSSLSHSFSRLPAYSLS